MTGSALIHGHLISTWTRTVAMTCVEKGIPYEIRPARSREQHPFGRIPVLELEGERVFETLAICLHLDDALPQPPLTPSVQRDRDRMRAWMSICADYVFRPVVRGIPRDRAPEAEELGTARDVLDHLEGLVGPGPFLAGTDVSLADLYLAPQVANCREKAPALLEGLDALGAWFARVESRESFRVTERG